MEDWQKSKGKQAATPYLQVTVSIMIERLRLENWKSFADATLHIDPLTVLIGMNASGKSNVLDALAFLQRIASGAGITATLAGDMILPPLRGGLEWSARAPNKRFSLEILVRPGKDSTPSYLYSICVEVNERSAKVHAESLQRKDTGRFLFYTREIGSDPSIQTYFATGTKGHPKRLDQNPAYAILSQVDTLNVTKDVRETAKTVRELLQSIFILDPVPERMREYPSLAEVLLQDASNLAGVLAALPDAKRRETEDILSHYLKLLPEGDVHRVWAERVGKFGTDAMLYCEEQWLPGEPRTIDARGMSDGTLRFLAIVTALLTCKPGSLLVVEEVDNGLHPSRADMLLGLLCKLGQKRSIDVLVTTHNPALLNALGPELLPFVSVTHRNRDGASAITLLEDIGQLPKLMAAGPLGNIVSQGRLTAALSKEQG